MLNDHPIYEVWITNSDDSGLKFIEEFEEFHIRFNDTVTMIPRYFHWVCPDCSPDILQSSCVCKGQYCGLHGLNKFNGLEILLEDLRQKCVYLNSKFGGNEVTWWDYMGNH